MSTFGFLLVLALMWLIIVPVIKLLLRLHLARKRWREMADTFSGANRQQQQQQPYNRRPQPHKHFGSDVGEYVDFEDLPGKSSHAPSDTPARGPVEKQVEDADYEDIK